MKHNARTSRVIAISILSMAWIALPISRSEAQIPDLGIGASLHGKRVLPADNAWNKDISQLPVDPNSTNLLTSIGLTTGLHPDFGSSNIGIPYVVVAGTQAGVPVTFDYADESDPGPYPIPPNAPIEGGSSSTGDRHVLTIDRDHWILYELFGAYPAADFSSWHAGSGAIFDLNSNALRTEGWTSADAAGLPIFPGLVRYDEVFEQGAINHALRFTVQTTRRGFIDPARHFASSQTGTNLPPMGMRVRLKASVNISGFSPAVQVILTALKKYGMIVADNGSNWYISGAPDDRWNDSDLHTLNQIHGSDFEVVQMGPVVTDSLAAPAGLHAVGNAGSIGLSWSASSGATGYMVKRSNSVAGPFVTIASNVAQTAYTDTTVTAGVTYWYTVSALQADTQSFDSGAASAAASSGSTSSSSAAFVKSDATTQGTWKGVYGADGYSIAANSTSLPSYASLTVTGNLNLTWDSSSKNVRALQKAGTAKDRIAACWYSASSFSFDLNLTDGAAHQIALYNLDWDRAGRAQKVDILDAATGAVLNSQSISSFASGKYLVWSVKGHVTIRVTRTAGTNAVISGVFFR